MGIISDIINEANRIYIEHKDILRFGQSVFIALEFKYPELAEIVRNTKYDPFYDDKKLEDLTFFLNQIADVKDALEWINKKRKDNANN